MRAQLDEEVETYIDTVLVKQQDRDRLRGTLKDVRSASRNPARARDSWDRTLYELSAKEPAYLAEMMRELAKSFQVVEAVVRISRAIIAVFEQFPAREGLFSASDTFAGKDQFPALSQAIAKYGPKLGIEVQANSGEFVAVFHRKNGSRIEVPATRPAAAALEELCLGLIDVMSPMVEQLYSRLSSCFRPNVAMPPLPEPFVVDVTEPVIREKPSSPIIQVSAHEFKAPQPQNVRIALPHFGIPSEFYNWRTVAYADEAKRHVIAELARAAIDAACVQQANVLVLPELCLPKDRVEDLAQYASDRHVALIAGTESNRTGDSANRHVNRCIVRIPESDRNYDQLKIYPSSYEPDSMWSDGLVHLFHLTSIGTFAVIICSDFLERSVLDAIGNAPFFIDLLFVPSANPHPELFEQLAMADSCRLFCHIVIANMYWQEGHPATSTGTLVCSPKRPLGRMIETSYREELLQGLTAHDVDATVPPSIRCFDVSIEDLQHERTRPTTGYLQVPHCRKLIP